MLRALDLVYFLVYFFCEGIENSAIFVPKIIKKSDKNGKIAGC
jgi:hypothetical protein